MIRKSGNRFSEKIMLKQKMTGQENEYRPTGCTPAFT